MLKTTRNKYFRLKKAKTLLAFKRIFIFLPIKLMGIEKDCFIPRIS